MINFKKFSIEISAMDAMSIVEFLNLVGKSYDIGDELVSCFSRFISAVDAAGCHALDDEQLFSTEIFDVLGSNGTGKRNK